MIKSCDIKQPIAPMTIEEDTEQENFFTAYSSFNLTMEEEYKKIRNYTVHIKNTDEKYGTKEQVPCDFLRYIANVKDDLEQMAF